MEEHTSELREDMQDGGGGGGGVSNSVNYARVLLTASPLSLAHSHTHTFCACPPYHKQVNK